MQYKITNKYGRIEIYYIVMIDGFKNKSLTLDCFSVRSIGVSLYIDSLVSTHPRTGESINLLVCNTSRTTVSISY